MLSKPNGSFEIFDFKVIIVVLLLEENNWQLKKRNGLWSFCVSFYCFLFSEWQTTHYLFSRIKSESFDLSALGSQECRWDSFTKVVYRSLSPAAKPAIRSALSLCILLWVQSKWSLCHCKDEQEGKHNVEKKKKISSMCLLF